MRRALYLLLLFEVAQCFPRWCFATQAPDAAAMVREARTYLASRDPTTRPMSYEADYEFTWLAREVYDESFNVPDDPPKSSPNIGSVNSPVKLPRLEAIVPPASSTGRMRVELSGRSVTIATTPVRTSDHHLHLHQLRQPTTIWQNEDELGEVRGLEQVALVDAGRSNRSPWPDQLVVPHVVFTAYLADDWARKFPRMHILYKKLEDPRPVATNIRRDGDDVVVSESFSKPEMKTRLGPYSQERITRYSTVGGQTLPTEVVRVNSGMRDLRAEIEWDVANVGDSSQPLMPRSIRIQRFSIMPEQGIAATPIEEQKFSIDLKAVQYGTNSAGIVAIPEGFSVLKRYPKGDPRESEEYIVTAAVSNVDHRWLVVFGTVIVILLIVGTFVAAVRRASARKEIE